MKNQRSIILACITLGLLTISSCKIGPYEISIEKDSKNTSVPQIQESAKTETPKVEDDKLEFTTFKGKQWLVSKPKTNQAPQVFGEFNNGTIIPQWYKLKSSTSDDPIKLSKVQLNILDLIYGKSEGNIIFDDSSKKWYTSLDMVHSKDPGFSGSKDKTGLSNAGFQSVNCYLNRPVDTTIRPLCKTLFDSTGSSMSQFANMDTDSRVEQFYKMKLGVYLTGYYSSVMRANSQSILRVLDNNTLGGLSTSLKLVYIDQTNQLGLGGATKLAKLNKKYLSITKTDILSRLRGIGVSDANDIFITGYGQQVDLNNVPEAMLRVAYSRVQWHNGKGNLTNFESGDKWLANAAKRWTFGSLLKGSPELKNEIKSKIVSQHGEQDWSEVEFRAIPQANDNSQLDIVVIKGDKTLYTSVQNLDSGRVYKPVHVAFGDILRRIASLPQSQKEFDLMNEASTEFLTKNYYQQFGMEVPTP